VTVRSAPEPIARIVEQSERFSLVMNGATLLYNLLLAELCVERQLVEDHRLVTRYRDALYEWTSPCGATSWSIRAGISTISGPSRRPAGE